ncbi:DUF805 domain-containing protein [Pleionea sp. CnH1-48]|uniref:DUF805 domain-containing protein n=1 Tax=Pleionea sp. CnH1-48 TaxID=2954494 RepID=UPI00209789B0|nr:DUF805 domain-containing protein [Pleionea sp. CnH1-48]MCO7224693.1 DUF805 domain-containing protein [Pleionea sp. CnH1-48]
MQAAKYNVILTGELIQEREVVVPALAALFKKSEEQIEKILAKAPKTIKKEVDKATAEKFERAITQRGAGVRLEAINEEPEVAAPAWTLEPTDEEEAATSNDGPANFQVEGGEENEGQMMGHSLEVTPPPEEPAGNDVEEDFYAAPESDVVDYSTVQYVEMSPKDILLSFNGRINRRTWWMYGFILPMVLSFVFMFLFSLVVGTSGSGGAGGGIGVIIMGILTLVLMVLMIYVGITVNVKRLHDQDKSGWWYLIAFIPLGGLVIFIMNGFLAGTEGGNQFGFPQAS